MPQIINTNIASLNAQRNLNKSQSANQTSLQRLSSGLRINSAKDDAAGLAISTRFNSQIRGLNVAVRNAGDGISLAQTAEGALGSMNDNLQRVRELAVQSANATNSDVDRDALQAEVSQLIAEVSRTADETDFNGRKLLDGSFSATFQIGANAGQTLDISISELTADKLGASQTVGVSAQGNSNALSNGDLLINGQAIDPSSADDDTSSVDNNAASAIAKVATINSSYEDTGVKAYINTNEIAGSEMTAQSSVNGNMVLNGVEINITTTADTASTRAAVAQAINAVSDQTGITAVDSEQDALGISLVAEDGRNISMGFDDANGFGSLTLAEIGGATGLALGATYNTTTDVGTYETYEGGFTLVADGDVGEIVISGGDGTGTGDVTNSGLSVGSYDRGVAQTTSTVITETTSDSIDAGQSFFALEGSGITHAHSTAAGQQDIVFSTLSDETLTITDGQGNSATLTADGTGDVSLQATAGGFGADKVAEALNTFTGVTATAETVVVLDGADLTTVTATSGSNTLSIYDSSSAGDLLGAITLSGSAIDTSQSIAAAINALTSGTLVAEVATTAANSDITVTDVTGNTLSFQFEAASAGGDTISIDVMGRTGGATTVVVGDSSNGSVTSGTDVIAVGYVKDIEVEDGNVSNFALTSDKALVGTYTTTGTDNLTTFLASAGLVTTGAIAATAGSTNITQPLTGLGDGDLLINDVAISKADPSSDTASATKASDGDAIDSSIREASGIAIAAAINTVSEETGVSAEVNATVVTGGDGTGFAGSSYEAGDSGKIYINGVEVGTVTLLDDGTGSVDESRSRQSAIDLINAKAGQTGVTAEDNGKSITLTAADGRNISVAIDNDDANNVGAGVGMGASIGLDSTKDGIGEDDIGTATTSNSAGDRGVASEADTYETTYSTVTLKSAQAMTISGGNNGADEIAALGLSAGTFGGGEDGQFLSEIDISTFEGATAALTAIDNAIASIASQRADLGAIQNRMESTVSNLAITSENLSAANSRIQDADFAAETAELSRTQVLQQAGISILAQANQGPQQVLSLLG